MIVGIGVDNVSIGRIEAVVERHGSRFLDRIFSPGEQRLARRMADGAGILAKRWAAKEACSKALGTGMRKGVAWRDIEVKTGLDGMPALSLENGAKRRLDTLVPPEHLARIHVSMTDDRPVASAIVLVEAVPRQGSEEPDNRARGTTDFG